MQMIADKSLINYTLSGVVDKDRPLLVFLHGWGRTMEDFNVLKDFLMRGLPQFAFLQFDLPGFGGSSLARQNGLSLEDYCTTLKELFNKLGLTQVIFVGHSLGGRIAIKFAALYPDQVEKLVLISAAGIPFQSWRGLLLSMGRRLFQTVFYPFRNFGSILRFKNLLGATFGSADYQTSHGALRETMKKVLAEDLRPDAAHINVPTLIVWGNKDQITPLRDAEEYHALIRDSRLEVLEGGHFAFLEKPKECAELVQSFLQH